MAIRTCKVTEMSGSIWIRYTLEYPQRNILKTAFELVQTLGKWLTQHKSHSLDLLQPKTQGFSAVPFQSIPTQSKQTPQIRGRAPNNLRGRGGHLPCEDHDEIHHVPAVPQVRAFVKNKAQSDDFDSSFKTKYSNKVRLGVVLERKGN